MTVKIGILDILPALEHPNLLAPSVLDALRSLASSQVGVVEIDPALSDTAAFCTKYGILPEEAANCVILEAKRTETTWFAACVVLGSAKTDVNGTARRILGARKASFAPMDQAVTKSGMEYGAITPLGLPGDWPILIDKNVIETSRVILGSGIRSSKIVIPGSLLSSLPNAQVVEGLALGRTS